MNILYVILFLTPRRGGSIIVPTQLSKEMIKRGHKITILTTYGKENKSHTTTFCIQAWLKYVIDMFGAYQSSTMAKLFQAYNNG